MILSSAGFSPLPYAAIIKDLASNGYVVIGINYTYDAPVTVFDDGTVVPVSRKFIEGVNSRMMLLKDSLRFRADAADYKV